MEVRTMKEKQVTARNVINALRLRFPSPQFTFLEQVANGTGARQYRWADAIAMSVWPSRGFDIHGIEVKVSRHDFLSELNKPDKSAAVQKYCNRWWMAIGDERIVRPGELPPTWGLLVLAGDKMKCLVEAPALEPEALTVEFVASVLRNMAKAEESQLETAKPKSYREGYDKAKEYELKFLRENHQQLEKSLAEFEEKSGIKIDRWTGGNVGHAVRLLMGVEWDIKQVQNAKDSAAKIGSLLDEVLSVVKANSQEVFGK